jgi:hypothetical protein
MDVKPKRTYSQNNGSFCFSAKLTDSGGEHDGHRIP